MLEHDDYMDIVRRAREWTKWRDEAKEKSKVITGTTTISMQTRDKYLLQTARLIRAGSGKATIAALCDTRSSATWSYRRSALIWWLDSEIRPLLKQQDKLQKELRGTGKGDSKWTELDYMIKKIGRLINLAEAIPEKFPVEDNRRRRHSKRRDLRGLPLDWKEQLLIRLPNYRQIYLVAAVSGCRPAEIANEVTVIAKTTNLEIYIKGAKVSATKGQQLRAVDYPYGTPLIDALRAEAVQSGGTLVVTLEKAKGPRQFSNAMAAAGKRLWPKRTTRVTPYMLRHQLGSDLKAAGRGAEEIAQILGHAVTKTQLTYGDKKSGRSGALPTTVKSARKPKETRTKKPIAIHEPKSPSKTGSVKSVVMGVAKGDAKAPASVRSKRHSVK